MISQAVREALQKFVPSENILYKEPLKNHTTFRVGGGRLSDTGRQHGKAAKAVRLSCQGGNSFFVMGNGSNLLAGDKGYRGIVLQISDKLNEIKAEGCRLRVQAGAFLSKAAKTACELGLTGLEFAAGIPGTVGGGVVMNAGAYDGEMRQVVEEVLVLDKEGTLLTLDNGTMEFGYRTSVVKKHPLIVAECVFC